MEEGSSMDTINERKGNALIFFYEDTHPKQPLLPSLSLSSNGHFKRVFFRDGVLIFESEGSCIGLGIKTNLLYF